MAETEFCTNLSPHVGIEIKERTDPADIPKIYKGAVLCPDGFFRDLLRRLQDSGGSA